MRRLVRQDIALLGRAEDQDLAAQVAAQVQQGGQVIARPLPDFLVRRGQVQGQRRLGEQPVQADDFETVVLDGLAGFPPLRGGDFRRRGGEREGSDLNPVIAEPAGDRADLGHRPGLEHLVAQSEFHLLSRRGRPPCLPSS